MKKYQALTTFPLIASRYVRVICTACFVVVALPLNANCLVVTNLVTPPEAVGTINTPMIPGIYVPPPPPAKPPIQKPQRVITVAYGQDGVLGGQYAGVAVDALLFLDYRTLGSSTANASIAMKNSIADLNSRTNNLFIIGHLVNQVFGGNFADANNFLIITNQTAMNGAMSNYGEASAKLIMERIFSKYYQGDLMNSNWVAQRSSANTTEYDLWFKPGILYETEANEANTLGTYNPSLIAHPNVTLADKNKLVWKLETKIRFIVHEYKKEQATATRFRYVPTGKYFEMPSTVYNAHIGYRASELFKNTGTGLSIPANMVTTFSDTAPTNTASATFTWTYINTDSGQ